MFTLTNATQCTPIKGQTRVTFTVTNGPLTQINYRLQVNNVSIASGTVLNPVDYFDVPTPQNTLYDLIALATNACGTDFFSEEIGLQVTCN